MDKVCLQTLNRGAVLDLFNAEFEKVLKNIEDENTDAKGTRSITIKIDLKPTEDRRYAETKVSVSSKLAGIKPTKGMIFFDNDGTGLAAYEDNPEQKVLDFPQVNFGG